ncbi:MAG: sigma 54-interacting transcriptional regulator [Acidobacteriota bacterium]|nr:sigma 54-interacting transcriptional regulator [Acidobacteriota bacterium]
MPSKALRQWTIPRRDLAAGGSALVRLSHPLLPAFVSARPGPQGLVLGLEGARPAPLGRLDARARRAYLVRLGSLSGFLSFHGLGVAADDVPLLGARDGDADRPALGAPPVAAWRAVPPALAVAAAALRLAGRNVKGGDADSLRRSIEGALDRTLPRDVTEDVLSALRAADARARPEALVSELARRGEVGRAVSRDLLGLALPAVSVPNGGSPRPAVAVGPASLWLARAAARRDEPPAFVECASLSALEEGGALRRLARALGEDPRAAFLEALADKARAPRAPDGPPVALVAVSLDRWDGRSRRAFEEELPALGFRLFATRAASLRPWEESPLVDFRMSHGDAASLLWLPFGSVHDAVAAWREAENAAGETDAGRFLEVAHRLAARFDPAEGRLGPARGRPAASFRPDPVLQAAALLASGFGAAEAAAAADVSLGNAEEALQAAAAAGVLVPLHSNAYSFRDDGERGRIAARVPASARWDAVSRLEDAGVPGITASRLAIAALARANAGDLAAARRILDAAAAEGDFPRAAELLSRAPRTEPDLGRPLLAVRVLQREGRPECARVVAGRITAAAITGASLDERLATARALVRLREEGRALTLCPGGAPEEDVARAWILVESRRDAEARRVLERAAADLRDAPVAFRLLAKLLGAELHERAHDYDAAGAALEEAEVLLPGVEEEGLAREMARTAGYLANDLGRTDEAVALFRRAEALSRTALERADSTYDVAYAALDGGQLEVAARELESALALYAASGHEERYLSALGNRVDLLLQVGDFGAARSVLERVLAHERAGGRDHQVLFALASLQELSLLDGDEGAAAAAFREAETRGAASPSHPSWREILLFEAERLLAAPDPEAALAVLDRAGHLPDNSARTEPHRLRLVASASRDVGRPAHELPAAFSPEERVLLAAETALASGRAAPDAASAALERLAATGAGAGAAVRRVLEWSGRFPAFFATSAAGPLLRLVRRIAARAGLARADERFSRLLEHGAPPESPMAPIASPPAVVAEDSTTRDLFAKAARVARSTISVLVLGESGTGKEIVARELHRLSGRRGPFLAVNVAALPGTLAEAELFGHARGAYTGADRDRRGLVEESSGGTLFLDEIGDLPLGLQGKLLRVLQEGEVRRLGETAVRRVDLRVLAATHRSLREMAEAGAFRIDLYFRLAGLELELAPLRERPKDLSRLIDVTLAGRATLAREASAALKAWAWPGNVRELLAALESAVALAAPGKVIGLGDLPRALRERETAPSRSASYQEALRAARLAAIDGALLASGGNRTRAARALGISRQSLLYEMKKLEIDAPRGGG